MIKVSKAVCYDLNHSPSGLSVQASGLQNMKIGLQLRGIPRVWHLLKLNRGHGQTRFQEVFVPGNP